MPINRAQQAAATGGLPAAERRTRGKSKQKNWKRPEQVAVIALELDLSGDPQVRRRLEKHWSAVFRLRRAVQRDAAGLCAAYVDARHERDSVGAKAVRGRLGLTRDGIEDRAKTHVERAGWMRDHFTKATALHMADEVWETCDRFLFPDASGRRQGAPKVGSWWDFSRIPGRARSHTKSTPKWETYRLVGLLQGHLDAYGARPGLTVTEAVAAVPGTNVFAQPKHLAAPNRPDGGWWAHQGALVVVYTGLCGGDLVMPVRLPQGAGQIPRLAHFLANPGTWHKIDLVRVRDRHAPGGWRHHAHLTVLSPGWVSPATTAIRARAPMNRLGGVDGNVSNIAIASIPAPGTSAEPVLATSHVTITDEQKAVTQRERRKARDRQRALDRSRRASNTGQYHLSRKQQARADQRAAAGLPAKTVDVPRGARLANASGVPTQAYRRDELSGTYRSIRADHATAASATAHRRNAYARQTARAIVAAHGPHLITEDVNIRTWTHRWGRGIAAFTPSRMLTALAQECTATGGGLVKASTYTTALSQHCLCGRREKKHLSQRWHTCICGIQGDRDITSAILAATVAHTDPQDPATARIDTGLREHTRALVRAGHIKNVPVTGETAQQEGPVRSTIRHNPEPGTGRDGSSRERASAGQGERSAQPRHRPHRGRRRTRRTGHTPPIHKPPSL